MELKDSEILIHTLKALKKVIEFKDSMILDLNDVEIVTPFYITPIVACLNSIDSKYDIIYPNRDYVRRYLTDTLKFPNGICTRNDLNRIGKHTYCPLYEIKNEMLGSNMEILEVLEKIVIEPYKLKKNISGCMFFLDELMCNIQEHANSNSNFIQVQKYGDKLSISIVDTGITIPQSYLNNGFKGFDCDYEVLRDFVFRGISTKDDGRGTGLPNTYRVVCDAFEGCFLLISRAGGVLKLPNSDLQFFDLKDLDLCFEGTIVNLMFEIPEHYIDYMKYINKPII